MRRWGANLGVDLRARKGELLDQINTPDEEADSTGLSADDWLRRCAIESLLMEIFKGEELFWQRRGGQKWLFECDANTAYFQTIAIARRRKCSIMCLWEGDTLLEHPNDIRSHIYSFFKELFTAETRGGVSLSEDFWSAADRASDSENVELTIPFSLKEVARAIASIKAGSASGPDCLLVVFFQKF
ncbi:uncharacterized protein LOC125547778 [Triticum urartu]|uniref:uncharacterized protein LOC125547778 n=1 Tax=Triticum urartu TaxID=4572 RepID=UPI00204438DF|nr:uncharacterized protein LOC125547778 [Triticum urartu]XP_048567511.1 uncharacterized protein LOC125547778 [Triticum urartu]